VSRWKVQGVDAEKLETVEIGIVSFEKTRYEKEQVASSIKMSCMCKIYFEYL